MVMEAKDCNDTKSKNPEMVFRDNVYLQQLININTFMWFGTFV